MHYNSINSKSFKTTFILPPFIIFVHFIILLLLLFILNFVFLLITPTVHLPPYTHLLKGYTHSRILEAEGNNNMTVLSGPVISFRLSGEELMISNYWPLIRRNWSLATIHHSHFSKKVRGSSGLSLAHSLTFILIIMSISVNETN